MKSKKYKCKEFEGITLISLVITIILLIILAGVVINLSIGENGLFSKAKYAKEKYTEMSARERLETVLMEAAIEKETNKDYNNTEYLNEMLKENQMEVMEDNIIVDNYNFVIDREKLIIAKSLGKTQIKVTKKVQEYLGKNENDKYVANTLVTIECNIEIENITFIKPDKTEITLMADNTKIAKDIDMEFDEEYKVKVKTIDGKEDTRTLIENSQEYIRNVEELVNFRDKVNSGLTYEGKKVKLVNNLELSSVCGENVNGKKINWEPIGKVDYRFKGEFDGNNNTISNIYINTNEYYQGLFGFATGIIKNLRIENSNIQGGGYIGAVVSNPSNNATLENIHTTKSVNVTSKGSIGYVGGIAGTTQSQNITIRKCSNYAMVNSEGPYTGGIVGLIDGIISECYNAGNINSKSHSTGGIAGINCIKAQISNCYNKGNVSGNINVGGIVGEAHGNIEAYITINNCYNKATIKANSNVSEIIGFMGAGKGKTNNCYTKSQVLTVTTTLGNAYIEDGKRVDGQGNIVDNLDEEGNKIYINEGFPILKWQK